MNSITPLTSLLLLLDKPVLVIMTDGMHIYGILRSVDQFSNLVLDDCFERVFCDNYYTENQLGLHVVQGNTVSMVSDIEGTLDNCPIQGMTCLSNEEFIEYVNLSDEEKLERNGGVVSHCATNADFSLKL